MKKTLAIILALVLCMSLCACGAQTTPEEKLKSEAVTFMTAYLNAEIGDLIVSTPEVSIASVTSVKENQWAVLGTATVATSQTSKMSYKFGMVATYDQASDQFEYSKIEFDKVN